MGSIPGGQVGFLQFFFFKKGKHPWTSAFAQWKKLTWNRLMRS